jgi:hypothetical protein
VKANWIKILIAVMACSFASQAVAQLTGANLAGQVADTTGAAIAGAQVTVQDTDTNQTASVISNAEGVYSVRALQPGHYTITVEMKGFRKYQQTGVILTVAQNATQNIVLEVGNIQDTVTVQAGAELINTTSQELSTVVNEKSIKELPLNGRDPSSLVFLAPGISNVLNTAGSRFQTGYAFPSQTGASANGGRQGSTYYLLDGVPNVDTYALVAAPFPNADATQEFRVITNNFDARYGFAPGAVVTIQTRGGENTFHGGVFEFIRNNDLNAGNYFTHAVDSLKRNQFGGFVGGPIRRDKLFFFANYQGTRAVTQGTSNVAYTPTAAMLNGDFTAVPKALNASAGFSGNRISPMMFSPAAVALAKTALLQGQNPATGQINYVLGSSHQSLDEGTFRVDYNWRDNQHLTLRSFIDYLNQPGSQVNGNILSVVNGLSGQYYNNVLSHTWTVNPSTVNFLALYWNQFAVFGAQVANDINGQPVCLSRYIAVNELPGQCWIQTIAVGSAAGGTGFSAGGTEPSKESRTSYGLNEVFTKVVGRHTVTAGVNAFHQSAYENTQFPAPPQVTFSGGYAGLPLADFLLGKMSQFKQGAGELSRLDGWMLGVFAQDQFRVRPNLTITAGVRWDPNLAPSLYHGRGAAFRPGQKSTRFPNAPTGLVFPGDAGINDSLMDRTYNYYEPRIGIAFQPKSLPNTAIHAGFGMFTSPISYYSYNHSVDINPFSPTYTLTATGTNYISFDHPWVGYTPTGGVSPFPPFASLTDNPPANSVFPTQLGVQLVFSPNFRLGITQSWNLAIDQQIGKDFAVHIAYVGNQSYHQMVATDQNPGFFEKPASTGSTTYVPCAIGDLTCAGVRLLYPAFAAISTNASFGTASYHSLQAGIEKRFSYGLQFQSNFTWSKNSDLQSIGVSASGNTLGNPFSNAFNYGISAINFPIISVSNFVYTTPQLNGHNGLMQALLGAWQATGIVTAQSGIPFSIVGGNGNNRSQSLQSGDRADRVPGIPLQVRSGGKQAWLTQYFNTAAFTPNLAGTFGNSAKNLMQAPPVVTADMGVGKNWLFRERYNLQFRWEAFNAFNHPSFGTPANDPSSPASFGKITAIGPIPPRVMQGALKLTF